MADRMDLAPLGSHGADNALHAEGRTFGRCFGTALIVLACLLFAEARLAAPARHGPLRTWRATNGIEMRARFVRVHEEVVVLSAGTKAVRIRLSELSEGDRIYVAFVERFGPDALPGDSQSGAAGALPFSSDSHDSRLSHSRTWTAADGSEMEASLVGVHGDYVLLWMGQPARIRFADLSEEDRRYIEHVQRFGGDSPPAEPLPGAAGDLPSLEDAEDRTRRPLPPWVFPTQPQTAPDAGAPDADRFQGQESAAPFSGLAGEGRPRRLPENRDDRSLRSIFGAGPDDREDDGASVPQSAPTPLESPLSNPMEDDGIPGPGQGSGGEPQSGNGAPSYAGSEVDAGRPTANRLPSPEKRPEHSRPGLTGSSAPSAVSAGQTDDDSGNAASALVVASLVSFPLLLVLAAVAAAVVWLVKEANRPERVQRQCARLLDEADGYWFLDPEEAERAYQSAIRKLERLALRGSASGQSGEKFQAALARARLGRSRALLVQNRLDEGVAELERAKELAPVAWVGIASCLASAYFHHGKTGADALACYVEYLRLPIDQVDSELARHIASLLEDRLRISEELGDEDLAAKARLNATASTIPGPGIRVVVEQGPGVGTQFSIPASGSVTIGHDPKMDIHVDDPDVSPAHARLDARDGRCTLTDLKSQRGTYLLGERLASPLRLSEARGTRLGAPVVLSDGARIRFGSTVLGFYHKPRPAGRELAWPHRNLGVAYLRRKDIRRAVERFLKAKALGMAGAEVFWYLGRCYEAQRRRDLARQAFDHAVAADPTHHPSRHARGRMALAQAEKAASKGEAPRQMIEDAVAHLRTAAELAKDRDDYWFDLARAYDLADQTNLAIAAVQSALNIQPESADYHGFLARQARKAGNRELAKRAAGETLRRVPRHVEASFILGEIEFEEGDYESAAEHLDWVRKAEAASTCRFSGTDEFAYRLGRSWFETGKYRAATKILAPLAGRSRNALFYSGCCHLRSDRFDSAAKIFWQVLSTYGEEPEARFHLATSLANLGEHARALQTTSPLEADAAWTDRALRLSGRLLAAMRRLDEAAAKFELARRAAPDDADLAFELGRVAFIRGDFADAAAILESAAGRKPDDVRLLVWLGRTRLAMHDYARATTALEAALSASPSDLAADDLQALRSDAHYELGRIARARGDHRSSAACFESARRLGNTSERLVYDLALAKAESDELDDALAHLSSLAMNRGDNRQIRANLAAISCRIAGRHFGREAYEQAIQLFDQSRQAFLDLGAETEAKEIKSALAESRFRLGLKCLFAPRDRLPRALEELQEAHRLRRGDSRTAYFLAVACFRLKFFDRAAQTFRRLWERSPADFRTVVGLAVCLEEMGDLAEAERTWKEFISRQEHDSKRRISGKLGLAGMHARQEDWGGTIALLQEILADEAVSEHPAYEAICRLAVSYGSLAGRHEVVEQIIERHMRGASPASADAYLGAIYARKKRWSESLSHLQKSVASKQASAEARRLHDHVARSLAAEQVRADKLREAAALLKKTSELAGGVAPETRQFYATIEAALLLGSAGQEAGEKALAAYEAAHRKQPDNAKILRNYAVLCHRIAITYEERGKTRAADPHWKKACHVWHAILESKNGFWQSYLETYNDGRHRRDRVQAEHLDVVRKRLALRLGDTHVEYAKAYAALGAIADTRRHVEYAEAIDRNGEIRPQISKVLLEKAAQVKQGGNQAAASSLFELAYEFDPENRDLRKAYAIDVFNRGTEALNQQHFDEAERQYQQAEKIDPDLLRDVGARRMYAVLYIVRAIKALEARSSGQADRHYNRARSIMPDLENDAEVRPMAAQYYVAKGNRAAERQDIAGARTALQKALDLDPTLLFKVPGMADAARALGIMPFGGALPMELMAALFKR